MSRKLAVALLSLLVAITAFAKQRAVAFPSSTHPGIGSGASVTGEVSSVSGNIISLAGGLVTIDATGAKILHGEGATAVEAIKPGMLITAIVHASGTASHGPLAATAIAILHNADVTFTGTMQSVDVAGSQFVLLNETIKVGTSTTFVNFGHHGTIAGLHSNMLVIVEANVAADALVASRITLVSPIPPRAHTASGVVKSIGTDAWVITVGHHDTTFVVNASTKILGSPKVGDKVEVLYTADTAHAHVALSIIKSVETPKVVRFTGVVKSIESARWVITRDHDHKDVIINWPHTVHIAPAASVGDYVEVVAIEHSDGTYTAVLIVPRR